MLLLVCKELVAQVVCLLQMNIVELSQGMGVPDVDIVMTTSDTCPTPNRRGDSIELVGAPAIHRAITILKTSFTG